MTEPQLHGVGACVFDAYGTLFDIHGIVDAHEEQLGEIAEPFAALWRTKQVEYTWLRSLMQRHADFMQVTQDALDYACDSFHIYDDRLRGALTQAYLQLQSYPGVAEVLRQLRARGLTTVVLSNGSPAMLQAGVTSGGLRGLLDHVLSVEEVGVFKPHPRVYQLAVDRLGVPKETIAYFSANTWDVAGAAAFGFQTVWVNRFGQRLERLPAGPDVTVRNLLEVPPLIDR